MLKTKNKGFLISLLKNVLLYLIMPFIISLLLTAPAFLSPDPISLTGIFGLISIIASGAICGFISAKQNKQSGIKLALLYSAISSFILVAVSLLLVDKCNLSNLLMNAFSYILTSVLFAYLGKREKKRKRRNRR
jgi:hypothetical protein